MNTRMFYILPCSRIYPLSPRSTACMWYKAEANKEVDRLRKTALFIGPVSTEKKEKQEQFLTDYAKKAHMDVIGELSGRFNDLNSLKVALANLKKNDITVLLVDSIESVKANIGDIGEVHQMLKTHNVSCYCIQNDLLIGADSHMEMKPHIRKAWVMTNGQPDTLAKLMKYSEKENLEVVHIDENSVCCDYKTLENRMVEMLKNQIEVILVSDGNVFEQATDPSLHAMTRLAMDYDMDIMIADMNINLCEVIHDMNYALEVLNTMEKQKVAVIYSRPKDHNPEAVLLMNEYVQEHGYSLRSFLEIDNSYAVDDVYIDNILKEGVDVLLINEGTVISQEQKEQLKSNQITIEEVDIQVMNQKQNTTQQYQA